MTIIDCPDALSQLKISSYSSLGWPILLIHQINVIRYSLLMSSHVSRA